MYTSTLNKEFTNALTAAQDKSFSSCTEVTKLSYLFE